MSEPLDAMERELLRWLTSEHFKRVFIYHKSTRKAMQSLVNRGFAERCPGDENYYQATALGRLFNVGKEPT